jgi:protein SCO1/2
VNGYLKCIGVILVLSKFVSTPCSAQVILENPPEMQGIDVQEHLGAKIPLDLDFVNDAGQKVKLGDYFHQGKPVVLTLAYYRCPMLCTLVLNGIAEGVKSLAWRPGQEFQMLTVSIDPDETSELAAAKKKSYLNFLGQSAGDDGWRFFVGDSSQSRKLAGALGFKYYYIPERKEFAHPAVVFLLTEDGVISRYLYGIQFKERDVRLGLIEASEGKIGTTVDRLILYCFHYDPQAKGYVVLATNVMKIGGLLTIVVLGMFLTILWMRDQKKDKVS